MSSPTEKLRVAERELKYRMRVYPRLVSRGTLSKEKADYEIGVMEDIVADYRALDEGYGGPLFALKESQR